jgi:hypothetical protein
MSDRPDEDFNFIDEGARDHGRYGSCPEWLLDIALPDACFLYVWMQCKYGGFKKGIFPSQTTVAEKLHMSVRSVQRRLEELQEVGALEIKHRGLGQTNLYILKWKKPK